MEASFECLNESNVQDKNNNMLDENLCDSKWGENYSLKNHETI